MSTSTVEVSGSCCASASLTIIATSSFWTPSCRSRSSRRRSSAKAHGGSHASRPRLPASVGRRPIDGRSDHSARRSLAASRSPRPSAICVARCAWIRRSTVHRFARQIRLWPLRSTWGMRTCEVGTPRNTPVPRPQRSSRQTPRVSSIRSDVHPGVSSPRATGRHCPDGAPIA